MIRQRLLEREVPGNDVRVLVVCREEVLRRTVEAESGDAVNPVSRDGLRRGRREAALETQNGPVVEGRGIGARALYRSDVAFCRIVVVDIRIVLDRRITDAETRPDNRLLRSEE